MAGSVNKVILIGNLGKDPEVRNMQNGQKVANLSLATSESWKDKTSGERKESVQWHRVVIFGQLADIAERYLKKGSKVYVCGQLQTRKWTDKDGAEKFSTEVVLQGFNSELTMLDGKDHHGTGQSPTKGEAVRQASEHTQAKTNGYQPQPDMDDDIPF